MDFFAWMIGIYGFVETADLDIIRRRYVKHPISIHFPGYCARNAPLTCCLTLHSHATRLTCLVTSILIISFAWRMMCKYAKTNASSAVGFLQEVRRKHKNERLVTYSDPRNHLSVPRRSERDPIASRNWRSTVDEEMCVPYGGKSELRPDSGAGGGDSSVWIGTVCSGARRESRSDLGGWTRIYR